MHLRCRTSLCLLWGASSWCIEHEDEVLFLLKKDGKSGMVDIKGNVVIPFEFNDIGGNSVQKKLFIVYTDAGKGVYDFSGHKIVPCHYDEIWLHNHGRFHVSKGLILVSKDPRQGNSTTYGYYNSEGKLLFPCKFYRDSISESEGIIRVFENGKWHYVDRDGNPLNNAEYEIAKDFVGDYAIVGIKGKGYGYINKRGELVIPCMYSRCQNFSNGLAMVEYRNRWGAIDELNNVVIPFDQYTYAKEFNEYGYAAVKKYGSGCGVIDREGNVVVNFVYDWAMYRYGLDYFDARGPLKVSKNGKFGVLDENGHEVIPCIYEGIYPIQGELKLLEVKNVDGQYGVLDYNNEIIIPFDYDLITFFYSAFHVKKNGLFALFNTEGVQLTDFKYRWIDSKSNNFALVAIPSTDSYNYIGVLNCITGKEVLPCAFNNCIIDNDYIIVSKHMNERSLYFGIYDLNGKIVLPIEEYERIYSFSNGLACIENKDRKCGYVNQSGEIVIPFIYDSVYAFRDGLARVCKNKKYGVINTDGEIIIECKYDLIENFSNGFARVRIGDKKGLINTKGEEIWFGE